MLDNLQSLTFEYAELTMDDILEANIGFDNPKESWDIEKLNSKLQQYCYLLNDLTPDLLRSQCSSYEDLQYYLRLRGLRAYLQKRDMVEKQAEELMKEAERFLILSNIDLFLDMMAQIRRNVIYSMYQFQPVMVKDQEEKSDKLVTNGRSSNRKPDPVGAVESSSSAASPQASA